MTGLDESQIRRAIAHDLHAFQIMGGGRLIHWPSLEEALGIETILHGVPGVQMAAAELLPRAAKLKPLRSDAHLTQVELAGRLGCSQALVSMAEKGRTWVGSEWEARVAEACWTKPAPRMPSPADRNGRRPKVPK